VRPSLKLLTSGEYRRRHLPGHPYKVAADAEVRAIADAALEAGTSYSETAALLLTRFGRARAPSRSALARYWAATHVLRG
jgi:hypothetical protein